VHSIITSNIVRTDDHKSLQKPNVTV